jgi:hypothetical protein
MARTFRVLRRLLLGTALGLLAQPASSASASLEYAVKAAFLARFPPFVTWPTGAAGSGPFSVCVLGDAPFKGALEQAVRGRVLGARPMVVRRLNAVTADDGCQVLYVGHASGQSPKAALAAVRDRPVLTVTDESEGIDGGIVHFLLVGGRVRFANDTQAARASGLAISSKLLGLAVNQRLVEP